MSADVRTTLQQVTDAVPVPAYDAEAVRARTRRLRRRRRGTRAAAGAVLVAVVAGGVVAPRLVGGGDGAGGPEDPTAVDRQAAGSAGPAPVASGTVPVVLDGQVSSVARDGSVSDLGTLAGTIVGRLDGRLVVLDGTVLRGAGDSDVDGVVAAYADPAGVTYQLTDGTVARRGAGGVDAGGAGVAGRLVAGGERGFVTEVGDVPVLHAATGPLVLDPTSDGARPRTGAVEIGGDTVVVAGAGVVDLYRLDGTRRGGFLGGTTGALSPDGATYAYAPTADERDQGMRPGLTRYDVASGDTTRTALPAAAVDLAWYGDDLWVVTGDAGARSLWSCRTTCATVLDDPTGTLRLR